MPGALNSLSGWGCGLSLGTFRRSSLQWFAFVQRPNLRKSDATFASTVVILQAFFAPVCQPDERNLLTSCSSFIFQEMILQSTPPPQKKAITTASELGVRRVDAPNEYFMPTSSDRFVLAFRQWLNKYAGEQAADGCHSSFCSLFVASDSVLRFIHNFQALIRKSGSFPSPSFIVNSGSSFDH